MKQGDRIRVTGFGMGTIERVDRNKALVSLDEYKAISPVEVPFDKLEMEGGGPIPVTREAPKVEVPRRANGPDLVTVGGSMGVGSDRLDKRMALAELRFGLVPESQIENLTIDFEGISSWIFSRLPTVDDPGPKVSQIYGPFGSGKTHAMSIIRHVSRSREYVTARVEVDGSKISLSDPQAFLYALWSTLSAEQLAPFTPLLELCRTAIAKNHSAPRVVPRGIDRVHDNYETVGLLKRPESLDDFGHQLNAVMSSSKEFKASEVGRLISRDPSIYALSVNVRPMIGHLVANRPTDFLAALLGYAKLASLAGYKGLVITVDEFEVEHNNLQNFYRVEAILDRFEDYWLGDTDHPDVPIAMFFGSVSTEGSRGDRLIDTLIGEDPDAYYELPVWDKEDRASFAASVYQIYADVYELDLPYQSSITDTVENVIASRNEVGPAVMRSFAKEYLSALDTTYGPSSR